ncbi:hypothetical protein U9M48_033261 [Paspalum notatum var. saurae]|uniref:Uncharacterized protein n=1 Tax=Paspalum notatum var. saurae TaxID=547442 RepID=A0AAQ3U9N2_PASNO
MAKGEGDNGRPGGGGGGGSGRSNPTKNSEQSRNKWSEKSHSSVSTGPYSTSTTQSDREPTRNLVRCIEGIAQRAPPPRQGELENLMGEFMKLRPTPFAGSHDPLEAYDRIKTIERKLEIINRSPGHSSTHRGKDGPGGKVTVKLGTEGKLPGKDSRKTSANIMFRAARDLKAKNSEAEANTMTMQEYIEKFTTRPVMHRKKSTPILRSASVSFGDRTPKSSP